MKKSETSVGVVSDNEEIWKTIPDYSNYEVSSHGRLRSISKTGSTQLVKFHKCKTTVGFYLTAWLYNDDFILTNKGVHYFVCLTFNGAPPDDGQKYEVNHIDGDKVNNRPENLEWLTRRENCIHAMKAGLRKDNIPVKATNVETGEIKEYYAIIEFARKFGLTRNDAYQILGRHKTEPYKDLWVFEVPEGSFGEVRRKGANDILAYDYVNSRWIVASGYKHMTAVIGISPSTIKLATDKQNIVAGYLFRSFGVQGDLPVYSKEEAINDRKAYFSKEKIGYKTPLWVKDYSTGTVTRFENKQLASKATGVSTNSINESIKQERDGKIKLHSGFAFKEVTDTRPWPEFTEIDVEKSKRGLKPNTVVFELTHLIDNTTELVYGLRDLVSKVGANAPTKLSFVQAIRLFENSEVSKQYKLKTLF